MAVFYYQFEGRTYVICDGCDYPTIKSPIWRGANTCVWYVPGTMGNELPSETNKGE